MDRPTSQNLPFAPDMSFSRETVDMLLLGIQDGAPVYYFTKDELLSDKANWELQVPAKTIDISYTMLMKINGKHPRAATSIGEITVR